MSKKNAKEISHAIEELVEIAMAPQSVKVKAGAALIKKGQAGNFLYVVKNGAVDIVRDDIKLERVRIGGVVGEMSLIDKTERSASVVAHEDSELIPMDRPRFLYLIRENPMFALFIMKTMNRRVRQMNVRLEIARTRNG